MQTSYLVRNITNKMHFKVYGVFCSLNSNQHVSAAIADIFRVIILLLQEYKVTNMINCAAITP